MTDVFDRNIGDLVRRAAVRPGAGARDRFLSEVSAAPERRSWKLAAAAAAALIVSVVVGSARTGKPAIRTVPEPVTHPTAAPPVTPPARLEGDEYLSVEYRPPSAPRPLHRLIGKSPFPDGIYFKVRIQQQHEELSAGSLRPAFQGLTTEVLALRNGRFEFDWTGDEAGVLRFEVSAGDELQERDLVPAIPVKEDRRRWTFEYAGWTDQLRTRLEPQRAELADLALEARKIVDACEAATASEERFRAESKALISSAERFGNRITVLGPRTLYPAAYAEIEYTMRNLQVLMNYFRWVDGKFAGPKSYYGDGKGDLTHRSEAFAFATVRRYLEESVEIAGREFCLWIVKDIRRAGRRDDHAALAKSQQAAPGVKPFAERLMKPLTPGELSALEAEIRRR